MRPAYVMFTVSFFCLAPLPALAQAAAACDALAADPTDPDKPKGVPGVPPEKIDGEKAVPVCARALAEDPDNARIKGQLAASLFRRDGDSDADRADRLAREAAEGGSVPWQMGLGEAAWDDDPTASMKWFAMAAKRGFPSGMASYGDSLDRAGRGAEAVGWYRKAAEAGDGRGMRDLAIALSVGRGIKADPGEAFGWNRKASEKGNVSAMAAVGEAYEDGRGVGTDMKMAADWYRKAAEGGYPAGMTAYGRMLEAGTGVAMDAAKANEWFGKAADEGDLDGMLALALNLDKGNGASRNPTKAFALLQKVAGAGKEESPVAMALVGFAYIEGNGVAADRAQGLEWLRKAAKAGDKGAKEYLASDAAKTGK